MTTHEVHAADHPDRGAMVACSCGWQLWIEDVPEEYEGWTRLNWLLDQRDAHAEEFAGIKI